MPLFKHCVESRITSHFSQITFKFKYRASKIDPQPKLYIKYFIKNIADNMASTLGLKLHTLKCYDLIHVNPLHS